jgi:hypothetical protein
VRTILSKVYEPLAVLIHSIGPLLKVQEILLLTVHEAVRDVVVKVAHQALADPWSCGAMNNVFYVFEQQRRLNLASVVPSQLSASSRSMASANIGGCVTNKFE